VSSEGHLRLVLAGDTVLVKKVPISTEEETTWSPLPSAYGVIEILAGGT
jgi:hypothetical protein